MNEEKIKDLKGRIANCDDDVRAFRRDLINQTKIIVNGNTFGKQLEAHAHSLYALKAMNGAQEKLKYLKGCLEFEQTKG
jgi:methyltransferase-like protein